jgi:AraC-like DNA-binding protein
MMPKLDGLGLCRALKADPETDFIPVILLTAKAAPEDKLEGLGEHADDYLTKPFDPAELRARIANLIAVRTRLRERFRQEGMALVLGEDAPAPIRLPVPEAVTSADDAFLERVREAVEAHLGDETFSVERLAEAAGVSRGHLHRQLKALVGQTPTDLIRMMRLERAAHLLAGRAGTVSEIAYAVGFKSVGHFSDSFVQAYGCRPSAYASREGAAEDETV